MKNKLSHLSHPPTILHVAMALLGLATLAFIFAIRQSVAEVLAALLGFIFGLYYGIALAPST